MAKKNRQSKQTRRIPRKAQVAVREADDPSPVPERDEPGEVLMAVEEKPATAALEPASSEPIPSAPDASSDSVPSKPGGSDPSLTAEKSEPTVPEELELLTFNLAGEEYAVDIMVIQEITKLTAVTHIPRIPSYIKGIITLRGNVIPVFDMHARMGLDPFSKDPKSRFIICTTENGMVAMLVDRVNDVVRLMRHHLEVPPASVAANNAGFIKNIAKYDGRLLILLEVNKTLRIDR